MSVERYRYPEHLEFVLAVLRPEIRRKWILETIEGAEWREEQAPSVVRFFGRED